MIPSDESLLLCIQRALTEIKRPLSDGERQSMIGAIEVVANELRLRCRNAFYLDYYERGRALAEEGLRFMQLGGADANNSMLNGFPKQLHSDLGSNAIGQCMQDLMSCIEGIVAALDPTVDEEIAAYVDRLSRWEISLYQHRLETPHLPATGVIDSQLSREQLHSYLLERFPTWPELQLTSFERLAGGFSKTTILFTVTDQLNGPQSLVMRAEQPTHILQLDGATVDIEFLILQIAHRAELPVPEPLWLETDLSKLGMRFLVSRKAVGRNYGTVASASEAVSEQLLDSLVTELARIHRVQLDPTDDWVRRSHLPTWLRSSTITDSIRQQVEYWSELFESAPHSASPLIRRGFKWLRDNVPVCTDPPVFLHGDYGLHNILIADEKVSAILDWEGARVGDPADDVSWFLGATERFLPREQLLEKYRAAGGAPIDLERLLFHDVLSGLKMSVICNVALSRLHEEGGNITMSVIGLRYFYPFAEKLASAIERAENAKLAQETITEL